ncbi:MAG: GNAT family N-acetyltransferase [Janthinobacterium lividum]
MPRFEIRPFAMPEAETVAAWATTPEDLQLLAASDDFPLTADQVAAWTYEADYALTLRRDGDLAAYAEIVEDVVEQDIEIQHLLVAPDLRSQGIGREMLIRLCLFLAEVRTYPEVWLRVSRDNAPAAACATAAGFEAIAHMSGPRYQWMKKSLVPK